MGRNPFNISNPSIFTTGYTYNTDMFNTDYDKFFPWNKLDKKLFTDILAEFIKQCPDKIEDSLINHISVHTNISEFKLKSNITFNFIIPSEQSKICFIFSIKDNLQDKIVLLSAPSSICSYFVEEILHMQKLNSNYTVFLNEKTLTLRLQINDVDSKIYTVFKDWYDKSPYCSTGELGLLS